MTLHFLGSTSTDAGRRFFWLCHLVPAADADLRWLRARVAHDGAVQPPLPVVGRQRRWRSGWTAADWRGPRRTMSRLLSTVATRCFAAQGSNYTDESVTLSVPHRLHDPSDGQGRERQLRCPTSGRGPALDIGR